VGLQKVDHAIVMGIMDYVEDAETLLGALRSLVVDSAEVSSPSCPLYFHDERRIREMRAPRDSQASRFAKSPAPAWTITYVCVRSPGAPTSIPLRGGHGGTVSHRSQARSPKWPR
jgi:hypothetical protein